jgi:hypothetical protein
LYVAVMLWLPVANELMANEASPAKLRGAVPITAAPSLNVTVPDGVIPPTEATWAVKVTDCPNLVGAVGVSVVVVPDEVTTCVNVADVLARKFPPPAYFAVIVWLPTDNGIDGVKANVTDVGVEVENAPEPIATLLSKNVTTARSGMPPNIALTTAVKLLGSPYSVGVFDDTTVVVGACATTCVRLIDAGAYALSPE